MYEIALWVFLGVSAPVVIAVIRFGVADVRFLLLAVAAAYGVSYPMDVMFFGVREIPAGDAFSLVGAAFVLFSVAFLVGAWGTSVVKVSGRVQRDECMSLAARSAFLIFAVLYVILLIEYGSVALVNRNDIYAMSPTLLLLVKMAIPIYFLFWISSAVGERNKWMVVAFVAYCLVELFIYGDRRLVVSALLGWLLLENRGRKVSVRPWMIVPPILVGMIAIYVEYSRYGGEVSLGDGLNFSVLNPAIGELGAPWFVALDLASSGVIEEGRNTILNSFGVLVPKIIWPGRPLGAAEWFVQEFYPSVAEQGGGFAFSFVIEVLLNFGWLGVLIVGVGLGWGAKVLMANLSWRGGAILVVFVLCFMFFPRYDVATIVKASCIGFMFIFFTYVLYRVFCLFGVARHDCCR